MTRMRMRTALGIILALGALGARSEAAATNPAYEQLTVTFNGSLSVAIDGGQYSTRALGSLGPGVTLGPSSATVINNGTFTARWQVSAADLHSASWSPVRG